MRVSVLLPDLRKNWFLFRELTHGIDSICVINKKDETFYVIEIFPEILPILILSFKAFSLKMKVHCVILLGDIPKGVLLEFYKHENRKARLSIYSLLLVELECIFANLLLFIMYNSNNITSPSKKVQY